MCGCQLRGCPKLTAERSSIHENPTGFRIRWQSGHGCEHLARTAHDPTRKCLAYPLRTATLLRTARTLPIDLPPNGVLVRARLKPGRKGGQPPLVRRKDASRMAASCHMPETCIDPSTGCAGDIAITAERCASCGQLVGRSFRYA